MIRFLRSFEAFIFKRKGHCISLTILLLSFFCNQYLIAQTFTGYTLYSPNNTKYTYLVNMNNTVVKSWTHTRTGGYSCYLLQDGSLIRSAISSTSSLNGGGATGIVQKVAWDGTLLWEYTYSSSTYRSHHDIEPMPNGNVLLIAWEVKTAAQCVAAGLNHSAILWPDHIIEVQPVGSTGGVIVWQWHAWDHLIQDYDASKSNYGVVANHPELLDINCGSTSEDWMHINGISYNATLDQIVISSHNLDELYVIDHSTTTAEAAGHTGGNAGKGGDILYRWGCPSNYDAPGTQVLDVVHNANWIPSGLPGGGNIIAFNNRESQTTSQIVEITPPMNGTYNYQWTQGTAYGPTTPTWTYTASGFYSVHLGGCQRLPNGNTLIAQSTSGKIFEVNSTGTVVWTYTPGGEIVRALRYAPSYSGLIGLSPELTSFTALIEGLYNGTSMIPDTVTIELRSSSSPYTLVDQATVLLNSNGQGSTRFYYASNSTPYYLVLKHRNAIETWSATTQTFSSNTLTYDFTTASNKAYGNNQILKNGKWCIFSGDVNQDGYINSSDVNLVYSDNILGITGYKNTDINGDLLTEIDDLNTVFVNSVFGVMRRKP